MSDTQNEKRRLEARVASAQKKRRGAERRADMLSAEVQKLSAEIESLRAAQRSALRSAPRLAGRGGVMTWLDEMAAAARDSMERYRCEVARMDLRATHAELRRVRRMNGCFRMDGRGDSDQRYKVEMLRARRDALGGGR